LIDLIDVGALASWLDAQGFPPGPVEDLVELEGGTQNLLVRFCRAGTGYVLRRPSRHPRPRAGEIILREARVLEALACTDVPHPRWAATCADESVLGINANVMLWLKIEPACLDAAGRAIAAHPEIPFAGATTGTTNLAASALFRDTRDLYAYLTTRLADLPGLQSVESAPIIGTVKRTARNSNSSSRTDPVSAPALTGS